MHNISWPNQIQWHVVPLNVGKAALASRLAIHAVWHSQRRHWSSHKEEMQSNGLPGCTTSPCSNSTCLKMIFQSATCQWCHLHIMIWQPAFHSVWKLPVMGVVIPTEFDIHKPQVSILHYDIRDWRWNHNQVTKEESGGKQCQFNDLLSRLPICQWIQWIATGLE